MGRPRDPRIQEMLGRKVAVRHHEVAKIAISKTSFDSRRFERKTGIIANRDAMVQSCQEEPDDALARVAWEAMRR